MKRKEKKRKEKKRNERKERNIKGKEEEKTQEKEHGIKYGIRGPGLSLHRPQLSLMDL